MSRTSKARRTERTGISVPVTWLRIEARASETAFRAAGSPGRPICGMEHGAVPSNAACVCAMMRSSLLSYLAPPLFVAIWATGFVVARLVAPYAEPLSFLLLRYALAIFALTTVALAVRAPWPRTLQAWRDGLVAGVLLYGCYLGGVFWAVRHGLPAGIAALVAGLQPLATGLLVGPLLGERVTRRRWVGIAIGFVGGLLVVAPKIGAADGFPPLPL